MLKFSPILLLIATSFALYPSNSGVFKLSSSNFDKHVINSDEIWIIEFYAPWCAHCQKFAPAYSKAAKALAGIVKVGAVDVDEHKNLGEKFTIRGFPTVKIFGHDKHKPQDYSASRTTQALIDAALNAINDKINVQMGTKQNDRKTTDVVRLTDENFSETVLGSSEMWLVEFYAPWCGHCKKLAPIWEQVATELKGKISVGALDATANTHVSTKYNINAYPTVKYFPPGPKIKSIDYELGSNKKSDIVNWALEKLAEHAPPPEILQIVDFVSFQEACETKILCVISFLPHIFDCQSKCRNSYLSLLKELTEKYKKFVWGWVWVEGGAQVELENSLGVDGFGYPVMAVVNVNKMKFSVLRGSFSKTGIDGFLGELAVGRGSTETMRREINVFATQPWDGKDADVPVLEEEDLQKDEL